MALQLLLQAASIAKKFLGLPGELRADSSNWDLLLDDGSKVGGHRFLNSDNADERYQARSSELDGLNAFEPQNKGFLVRRGNADYRVRTIQVNTDNLTISNAAGYAGNPYFSLAGVIESAHTWGGIQTFEQPIEATGGLEGDVRGNVTGNLTGDTTGKHKGSVDASGADFTVDDGDIKLAFLEEKILQRLCPIGAILIWSGAANAIPVGWKLCNGTSNTPDLRDRFVVGAGKTLAVGDTGGDDPLQPSITVESGGAHSHTGSLEETVLTLAQIPSHNHGNGVNDQNTDIMPYGLKPSLPTRNDIAGASHGTVQTQGLTDSVGGGEGHTHGFSLEEGGSHSHTATIEEFEAVPPYYALCYIMKGPA